MAIHDYYYYTILTYEIPMQAANDAQLTMHGTKKITLVLPTHDQSYDLHRVTTYMIPTHQIMINQITYSTNTIKLSFYAHLVNSKTCTAYYIRWTAQVTTLCSKNSTQPPHMYYLFISYTSYVHNANVTICCMYMPSHGDAEKITTIHS